GYIPVAWKLNRNRAVKPHRRFQRLREISIKVRAGSFLIERRKSEHGIRRSLRVCCVSIVASDERFETVNRFFSRLRQCLSLDLNLTLKVLADTAATFLKMVPDNLFELAIELAPISLKGGGLTFQEAERTQ